MADKRILVIGSGERVRKAALPVFERAEGFELAGVVSRTPKTIESDGREYEVRGLDSLTRQRMTEVDLVYMVVKKPVVPQLLKRLGELDCSRLDLLIETPVMLVRHLGHRKHLKPFRNVWVSEDCETLPCFDAAESMFASGAIGKLRSVTLDRSAYAYHGIAMAKSILGGDGVRSARQKPLEGGQRQRQLTMTNGLQAHITDPRDYAVGTMLFEGVTGELCDVGDESLSRPRLEAMLENGRCVAFRAGDSLRRLSSPETELMGERGHGIGITAWMDGMKRVGFLRLMERIHTGAGAYPLESAIEDSVVDYYLEKLGRYRASPLTRPSAALPRMAFALITKLLNR